MVIDKLIVSEINFTVHDNVHSGHRLINNALGDGGIFDVGCYCVSLARLLAGVAIGKDFAEPTSLVGQAHIGEMSRVDEYAVASLTFRGDILAQLFTGVQVKGDNRVRIFGSEGSIEVPVPWVPRETHSRILLKKD